MNQAIKNLLSAVFVLSIMVYPVARIVGFTSDDIEIL